MSGRNSGGTWARASRLGAVQARAQLGLVGGLGEQAVGVSGGVGVETDEGAAVVDPVQRGGAHAVGIVDVLEAEAGRPDEPVGGGVVTGAVGVGADDLVAVVDTERHRRARSRNVEAIELVIGAQQVALGRARAVGGKADDVALVVDPGGGHAAVTRDVDGPELARADVIGEAVVVALGVRVETDGDIVVVDRQQLVDHRLGVVGGGEVGGLQAVALERVEAMVGALAVDPEPHGVAVVVDAHHLGLRGARKVLVGEVALPVLRADHVAAVRMALFARAEVAGDGAGVIDPQQLVEGVVAVVVDGVEGEVAAGVRRLGRRRGRRAGHPRHGQGRCRERPEKAAAPAS